MDIISDFKSYCASDAVQMSRTWRAGQLGTYQLARACGIPVGRRLGGRLAMTLVATINIILFHFFNLFFSPSRPFLKEEVLGLKNLFSES